MIVTVASLETRFPINSGAWGLGRHTIFRVIPAGCSQEIRIHNVP